MATTADLNGTTYSIPQSGETGNGDDLTTYLVAVASAGSGILQFGNSATPSGAGTTYLHPGFAPATTSAGTEIKVRVPAAGKISNLYVQCTGGSTGGNIVLTVRANGSDTTITTTLAAAATQGADTSHTSTVTAGTAISVKVVAGGGTSAGAANLVATLLFTPS